MCSLTGTRHCRFAISDRFHARAPSFPGCSKIPKESRHFADEMGISRRLRHSSCKQSEGQVGALAPDQSHEGRGNPTLASFSAQSAARAKRSVSIGSHGCAPLSWIFGDRRRAFGAPWHVPAQPPREAVIFGLRSAFPGLRPRGRGREARLKVSQQSRFNEPSFLRALHQTREQAESGCRCPPSIHSAMGVDLDWDSNSCTSRGLAIHRACLFPRPASTDHDPHVGTMWTMYTNVKAANKGGVGRPGSTHSWASSTRSSKECLPHHWTTATR